MNFITPAEVPDGIVIAQSTAQEGYDFSRAALDANTSPLDRVMRKFGISVVVTLKQIHSALIKEAARSDVEAVSGSAADGLFSADKGVALGILTADCYPVFLAGKVGICALHCGWRGTLAGIIKNAAVFFERIGDAPEYAYIGAGISAEKFTVRQDFIANLPENDRIYLTETYDNDATLVHFNLADKIRAELAGIGCRNILSHGGSSASDTDFYSHRRDATQKRMLAFIFRKPQ
jgi:copper oxidase (laccase) domain-containing protein